MSEPTTRRDPWVRRPDGVTLLIRVSPRGGSARYDGIEIRDARATLRVRVPAAPVDGAANKAVIRFLAASLNIAPRQIMIENGEKSRIKRLSIVGDPESVTAALERAASRV